MRAFVESERTGLMMDQIDPREIARAMREAYRDRSKLHATGERLDRIKDRYCWPARVYRELLPEPS
ncbi:MAG: hypothetical protein M3436_11950 [Pseudomonadota bacterium]|nr:hypothetical protein [Pseudomonadota bacterium]